MPGCSNSLPPWHTLTVMPTTNGTEKWGLWTDEPDADEQLRARFEQGLVTQDEVDLVSHFIRNGYVVMEGVVPHDLCDQLADELKTIFTEGSDIALYQEPTGPPGVGSPVPRGLLPNRMRLVDMYGVSANASRVLMNDQIRRFMEIVFEAAPLCFQGLTFERGSGQGFHQDTAYVVVDKPLRLAASWVALEDIGEGSGELMYIVGSHRLSEWRFGGDSKHWDPNIHGQAAHEEWTTWLTRRSEELGLEKKLFRPHKGDVLIWAADLVHGGSPVADPTLSRRSIVGHYCPADCTPHYFTYMNNRVRSSFNSGFFSSSYYDLPVDLDAKWESSGSHDTGRRSLLKRLFG